MSQADWVVYGYSDTGPGGKMDDGINRVGLQELK